MSCTQDTLDWLGKITDLLGALTLPTAADATAQLFDRISLAVRSNSGILILKFN